MKSSGASAHCTVSRSNNRLDRTSQLAARLLGCALIALGLGLAGCESGETFTEHISQRITPQPKVQTFEGEQRAVFDAALAAMKVIDFRVTRSGAAQGLIQGISGIQSGDNVSSARQYTIEVHVHSYEPKTTEVSVLLHIQEESAAFSGATDLPLKDHRLYDSYFEAIQDALHNQSKTGVTPADSAK